jgi:hypothetical protein
MKSLHVVEIIRNRPHFHHALSIISCQSLYLRSTAICQSSDSQSLVRSLTGFGTTLVLVEDSGPESLGKAVLDALHLDEPVSQIHSSRIESVDGLAWRVLAMQQRQDSPNWLTGNASFSCVQPDVQRLSEVQHPPLALVPAFRHLLPAPRPRP